MAKKILRDRIEEMLVATGVVKAGRVLNSRSSRYVALESIVKPGLFYFLGKSGAVRKGKVPSKSMSVTDQVHKMLVEFEAGRAKAS